MKEKTILHIRICLGVFMFLLIISGLTAIPLRQELEWLLYYLNDQQFPGNWLHQCHAAIAHADSYFPFLLYGTDWLAFAHFIIALVFVGPLMDPIKNKWVIQFGLLACLLVIPAAMAFGYLRGIPLGWLLIDCSFGIIDCVPLFIIHHKIIRLESQTKST